MTAVFADSLYWIALVRPGDAWEGNAMAATGRLGKAPIVTTDEVLTEFLAALSGGSEFLRREAVRMTRAILHDPNVKVAPQSRETFLAGLELFEQRPDKEYSLTDCVSMNTMRAQNISEALTNDHHFEQEGFTILMRRRA